MIERMKVLLTYFWRRNRVILILLSVWSSLGCWLFAWMTSQTALREGVSKLLKILPAPVQKTLGESVSLLLDPTGALSLSFDHPVLTIPILFWTLMISLRHLAADRERGILDVILTKPVRRGEWLAAIIITQIMGLFGITLASAITLFGAIQFYPALNQIHFDWLVGMLLMQLLWGTTIGAISSFFAAKWGRFRLALGASIGTVLIMIVWEVLCRSIKSWTPYIVLSLRHWSEPHTLFPENGWSGIGIVVYLTVSALFFVLAYLSFRSTDLNAS